jgi:hypothetical protein
MARQPSRLGQLPPGPGGSRRDIAAIERGEARLVSYPRTGWAAVAGRATGAGRAAVAGRAAGAGRAARRPGGRAIRWRSLAGAVSVAIAVVLIVLGAHWLAMVAINLGALLLATSIFSGFRMCRDERREKHTE